MKQQTTTSPRSAATAGAAYGANRPTSAPTSARPPRPDTRTSSSGRGPYFTLQQATEAYPVFTIRLLRRLVQERRIAFSKIGRSIILSEADIEAYVEANRVEPPRRSPQWDLAS